MSTLRVVMWTALAASLAAQESEPGFRWLGFRAGGLSYDPQEKVKAAPSFGLQGGLVFEQQRFGLTFEGFLAHPKNDLFPDKKLNHIEASITFLVGLSGDPASRFWPYLGLGLGGLSVPRISTLPLELDTARAVAAHYSLGFLHRPASHLIWGLEGRYLTTFTGQDRKQELQGSLLIGFSWQGRGAAARPMPHQEAPAPPPTQPPPAVLPVQAPVASPPPAPVPTAPPPVPRLAPPPPEPTALPAPPAQVAVPVPLAIGPVKGAKVAEDGALVFSGKSLNFGNNSTNINVVGMVVLGNLAKVLRDLKVPYWLLIDGHTSSTGALEANVHLSQMRSKAVAAALVAMGLPGDRMVTRGFGPTRPIAPNETKDGQLLNRRVEVRVYPGERPAQLPDTLDAPQKALLDWNSRQARAETMTAIPLPVPVPAPPVTAPPMPVSPPMNFALPDTGLAAPTQDLKERLDALRQGDLAKAVALGRKRIAAVSANRWTLRLDVADLPSTLRTAVASFSGKEPDLFIVPIKLRGGKTSYQVFLGDYPSKADAERAGKTVPSAFLEGGQRPKPFLVHGIPNQTGP